jgi:aspartate/methionine/tyrosine aminotransferase
MNLGRRIFLDRTDRVQRLAVPSQDLARIAERLRRRGIDIIDLSRVSNRNVIDQATSSTPTSGWQPATADQVASLREAAAHWYEHRFGVTLDPDLEITFAPNAVIGMTLLALAFVEAGDMVLLPDPGAVFYRGAVVLSGGGVIPYHLSESNGFRPRFAALAERLVGRTRMIVISYPHNPTTTVPDNTLFSEAVAFARKNQTLVVSDAAFSFASDRGKKPPSFLSSSFATGVGVELAALDTNYGIAGLSLALLCGNREAVSAVSFLAESSHWAPSQGMVSTAIHLLLNGDAVLENRMERLAASRQLITNAITEIGWTPHGSATTPFLWVSVPARVGAEAFCRRMLRRTGVLMAPGSDFGEGGEGFVRMTIPDDVTSAQTVCERLHRHAKVYQRRLPRPRVSLSERLRRSTLEE